MAWHGYLRIKNGSALSAGQRTTIRGLGLQVSSNPRDITSVRLSIDSKEAIIELTLDVAPRGSDILSGISEFALFSTDAEAREYIAGRSANWENAA